jgi:hypothetical protein
MRFFGEATLKNGNAKPSLKLYPLKVSFAIPSLGGSIPSLAFAKPTPGFNPLLLLDDTR